MQLRAYQTAAVEAVYDYLRQHDDNPVVVMPVGCHAIGHPILMYDGTVKPVEQVLVGDEVMGPDSTPRHVLALCRGEDELFRITPCRGAPFVVNGDHCLSLVATCEGKPFPSACQGGEITNLTVREFMAKSKCWRSLRKLYRVPIKFSTRHDLPVPPYILGLLLGDGHLSDLVNLTTADDEIVDAWTRYAESIGCSVRGQEKPGSRAASYTLRRSQGKYNVVTETLDALGLAGHRSSNKFIPHIYLTASREDRLQLLAGLIDSDGSRTKAGFEYTTQSRELADDLAFLLSSLGFSASCCQKFSYCQTGNGGWYFRLHSYGDLDVVPCRLMRKRAPARRQKKNPLRTGFTVEPCGRGPFYGFLLDQDHLYVDGHFVVHHNSGKTPVLATICRDAVMRWDSRVLVVSHVKELIEQAVGKLRQVCPELPLGVYSAGLGRRETRGQVICAGIQSIYKRACELDAFDLIIIDECHLLPREGEGMYRQFLQDAKVVCPHQRVIGLTATPYRLDSGLICDPQHFLNAVCFEVGIKELIRDGYLTPLVTKAGSHKADVSQLHLRGGEFAGGEAEQLMNEDALVLAACEEIVHYAHDRQAVLIFAAGVAHAHHIQRILQEHHQQECGLVIGSTPPAERSEVLARFCAKPSATLFAKPPLKYVVNYGVLTTGFDNPRLDVIAILRPTMSPGLLVQMIGRGTRLHPGKRDCLVLDYAGNIERHGPIDQIAPREKSSSGSGTAPAKECPQCHTLLEAGYAHCPDCGYAFPPPASPQHAASATTVGVLSGQVTTTDFTVLNTIYSVHVKRGAAEDAPRTLRVDYQIALHEFKSEWVCLEHTGYARTKAIVWWRKRSPDPVPDTIERAVEIAEAGGLAPTETITVRTVAGEPYERIIDYQLGPIPEFIPLTSERPDHAVLEDIPF